MLMYRVLFFLCTFIGLIWTPVFLAFQMLEIIPRYRMLQFVLQAITERMAELSLTVGGRDISVLNVPCHFNPVGYLIVGAPDGGLVWLVDLRLHVL